MHKYRPPKPPKVIHKPRTSFINHGISKEELDLHKTINLILPGVQTIKGDRTILEGREIDIYIPKFRLGIEYDGLAFHSDSKEESYHLWKTVTAAKKKVKLIHIWSDLWNNRRAQVVDFLSKLFGKYQEIPFEECEISEIPKTEGRHFLSATHIMSYDSRANRFIGIYKEGYLIEVVAFKVNKDKWVFLQKAERSTLCVKDDLFHVIDYIKTSYKITELTASIDRSLFDGEDLKTIGFYIKECTPPKAHWTKDYKIRKLQEKYTDDQMIEAGYHRFYDCGELILQLNLHSEVEGIRTDCG